LHELAPIVSRIAAIRIVGGFTTFDLFDANSTPLWYQKGLLAGVAQMRIVPVAVSLGLVAAVTAILWQINLSTSGSHRLVYFYLFPVALIAALYNGRLAVLCTAIALVCADYFLQEPLYSLANDNPLEYGDLIWLAVLAAIGIKFIRVLVRPRAKIRETRSRYGLS
jgi:K+-sensing histidine kinase KdpD